MAVKRSGRKVGAGLLLAALLASACAENLSQGEVEAVYYDYESQMAAHIRESIGPFAAEADQGLYGEGDWLVRGDTRDLVRDDPRLADLCEQIVQLKTELNDYFDDKSDDTQARATSRGSAHENALSNMSANGFFAGLYDEGMIELDDPSVLEPDLTGPQTEYPFAWQGSLDLVISSDGVLDGMTVSDAMTRVGLKVSGVVHLCVTSEESRARYFSWLRPA